MKRMSDRQFRSILCSVMAIVIALTCVVNQTALKYSAALDWALGRGERHVTALDSVRDEDVVFYETKYASAEDSKVHAALVAQKIAQEGIVLLKNQNDLLPLKNGDSVTPMGYRYVNPFYVGEGSAAMDTTGEYIVTPEEALSEYFTLNTAVTGRLQNAEPQELVYADDNGGTNIYEFDPAVYRGSESTCGGSVGLVFIGRTGLEGFDYNSKTAYEDGTETQMHLSRNEKAMVEFSKANCDHTVVILNCPSALEIVELQRDASIDAILWIGLPGSTGYRALAQILCGEVNPSGKTSMLWSADLSADPTFVNRYSTAYTNAVEGGPSGYIEYEEGIYVGYRYYETRYAEDNTFPVFGGTGTYDDAVVYPFGYGMNYSDDQVTQTLDRVEERNGIVTVSGTITNASAWDVNEVVQIYFGAPYTPGGIEKSAKELVAYDKIAVTAGGRESFTLQFDMEDMASYDHLKLYSDTGSYVLESGDYQIYLGKNSHESWGSDTVRVPETLVYAQQAKSGRAVGMRSSDLVMAENQFDDMAAYAAEGGMITMSRADFAGTFPTAPEEKPLAQEALDRMVSFDYKTDAIVGEMEGSVLYRADAPVSKANNGTSLSSLRGLDYDDPMWDELLDNLDYTSVQVSDLITYALYRTAPVDEIGLVETSDHDGTAGLTATWGGNNDLAAMFGMVSLPVVSCAYPCSSLQSATWNEDLMREMGEMLGQEALSNGITGWYAPGINLQRTPYGGRNFEYFSEDPVLSGRSAAALISGAYSEGGLVAYLKHFILNETDDNRSGVSIWVNEQAMRQLYLKPFELAVKNAKGTETYYNAQSDNREEIEVSACRAIMTAMCYVGTESPTNSYRLLTNVLRNEWGFRGMVLTDMNGGSLLRNKNVGYRVGNDIWMTFRMEELDFSSPTAQWCARNAVHNVAYVVVNSNSYNNVKPGATAYYDMSPWQRTLYIADVAVGILCLAGVAWMVLRQRSSKKTHKEEQQ